MTDVVATEKQSSIEVSRNAKGDFAYKAKLYFNEDEKGYVTVIEELKDIMDLLYGKFK